MASFSVNASAALSNPYDIQLTIPTTPHFARPPSPKKGGDEGSPGKEYPNASKSVRYNTQRRAGELSDVLAMPNITPAQKKLASLVWLAAGKLRQWCEEVEQWTWDGTFRLSSEDVDRRSRRLRVINEELKALLIEELKDHVLDIYIGRSRPGLNRSIETLARLPVNFLDEYELFVTQTLVQALPQMMQLKEHLRSWSVRIFILQEAPTFLSQLQSCRQYLTSDFTKSWDPVSPTSPPNQLTLLQNNISNAQRELQDLTQAAGRRLDAMLDGLEGSDDTLPDEWIDDYENLEADYTRWTVEADNWIIQIEIAKKKAMAKQKKEVEKVIKLASLTPKASSTKLKGSSFLDTHPALPSLKTPPTRALLKIPGK